MNNIQKYFSTCLLATGVLLFIAPIQGATAATLGAASNFTVLGSTAVTCTTSVIAGNVGSGGAFTNTGCTIGGTVTAPVSAQVLTDFNSYYDQFNAANPCTQTFTEDIAGGNTFTGQALSFNSGVICFPAAATFTDSVLTLNGSGPWIFKVGILGTGALTGTGFSVVMANGGQACDVTWWVAQAATMTDSHVIGSILAGAAITMTDGTNTLAGGALAKAAVTMTNASIIGCGALSGSSSCNDKDHDGHHNEHERCNQGVGNEPEGCDPGNSNHRHSSNDENGGTPGNPGRKGDNR